MAPQVTLVRQLQTLHGFCMEWASIWAFLPFSLNKSAQEAGPWEPWALSVWGWRLAHVSLCINLTQFKTSTPQSRNHEVRGDRAGKVRFAGWRILPAMGTPLWGTHSLPQSGLGVCWSFFFLKQVFSRMGTQLYETEVRKSRVQGVGCGMRVKVLVGRG